MYGVGTGTVPLVPLVQVNLSERNLFFKLKAQRNADVQKDLGC